MHDGALELLHNIHIGHQLLTVLTEACFFTDIGNVYTIDSLA